MKQRFLYNLLVVRALVFFSGHEASAQTDLPRFEIGGQFSLLHRNKPTAQDDEFVARHVTNPGFGARFTYNLTNEIAFVKTVAFSRDQTTTTAFPVGIFFKLSSG